MIPPEPPKDTAYVQPPQTTLEPNVATVASPTATPPVMPPPIEKKPLIKNKMALLFFVLIVVILLVVSVAAFLLTKSNQTGGLVTPTPTETPIQTPIPTSIPSALPSSTPSTDSSPTVSPNPQSMTKTITPENKLDGYFTSSGSGSTTVDVRAGRSAFGVARGFVSFTLTDIPANATIQTAVLRLYQANVAGSPYASGGALKVDHLEFGPTLEAEDYLLAPLQANFGTVTSDDKVEWKEIVVTDQIRNDIKANRTRSQYRIHFTIENMGGTGAGDFAYFESSENFSGTGNIPQLVVTYQ